MYRKLSGDHGDDPDVQLPPPDATLLSEEDKAAAIRRPASSFTGLRRGTLEGRWDNKNSN